MSLQADVSWRQVGVCVCVEPRSFYMASLLFTAPFCLFWVRVLRGFPDSRCLALQQVAAQTRKHPLGRELDSKLWACSSKVLASGIERRQFTVQEIRKLGLGCSTRFGLCV